MPLILRSVRNSRLIFPAIPATASSLPATMPTRSLTSTPLLGLKEDAERTSEHLESKKQEQLQKQQEGRGEWHESLASSGESSVKADRDDVDNHEEHMEELQKAGKKAGESGDASL
ncbi:hypothetical protein M501DRAFT_977589 [Patellaria atrata CBS 101060]|uniref:Mitochondrial carrier protein pet8 n=1 Tax=Patellaria atrata CBS 101060 TaxID=1346257 RepID=A0A9P4S7A9_9PEZI|nr:hypothetical protein M501DRAFT_977589 [Patellaria atrata CBS 101060]